MNVLGVEPGKHNGTWANVEGMLSDGWENRVEDSSALQQYPQTWSFIISLALSAFILRYI